VWKGASSQSYKSYPPSMAILFLVKEKLQKCCHVYRPTKLSPTSFAFQQSLEIQGLKTLFLLFRCLFFDPNRFFSVF
jgi:hypothetical protein